MSVLAKRNIAFAAYDISVASNQIALLQAHLARAPTPFTDPVFSERDDVAGRFEESGERWSTVLHRYDQNGNPRSSVGWPFEVLQPPVLCEGGRAYLAGRGLAAIDGS